MPSSSYAKKNKYFSNFKINDNLWLKLDNVGFLHAKVCQISTKDNKLTEIVLEHQQVILNTQLKLYGV